MGCGEGEAGELPGVPSGYNFPAQQGLRSPVCLGTVGLPRAQLSTFWALCCHSETQGLSQVHKRSCARHTLLGRVTVWNQNLLRRDALYSHVFRKH